MKEMINQLKQCKKKDVLIIGEILLDEYLFGKAERISSEAPVPVIKEQSHEYCLGGAGNLAANCAAIGIKTSIVSVIGNEDFAGQKLISLLKEIKIPTSGLIKIEGRKTTHKKRILAQNQQLLCIDTEDETPLTEKNFKTICSTIDQLLKPEMIVVISDYDRELISKELVSFVIQKASKLGCLVMVDPSGPFYEKYKGVDYIKPNLKEFNEMVECFNLDKDTNLFSNGLEICKLLECNGLFLTMGEMGIQFISKNEQTFSPTQAREVYGLVGAGDTVLAYLVLGIGSNLPIPTCLNIANKAAAVAISYIKTYPVGLDELINKEFDFSEKIFTEWSHLKIELDWQSSESRKVVFTNGCFDILHAGHIHLLKEAKRMGSHLIVGINSDESVKKLDKGADRPVNPFENRAMVVAALGIVDFVVKFDQESPRELIEYLKPEIFVKGGDYSKVDTNPESDSCNNPVLNNFAKECEVVKKYGGAVKIINLIPELSTTAIIKKIKGNQI